MPNLRLAIATVLLLADHAPGQEPIILTGQGGWIGAVAFRPDSRCLAVGASDGSIAVWDGTLGKKIAALRGHEDAVAALAFTADGSVLVSGGHDRVAIVQALDRDPKKTDACHVLRGHTGAVLSLALTPDGKHLYTGSIDSTVRAWDIATLHETRIFRDHLSWVNSLAI